MSNLIDRDENDRLDKLTEIHRQILADLRGEDLDVRFSSLRKRRGLSDAAYRQAVLDNTHPDDLSVHLSLPVVDGKGR